jgi:hypothetical protein
VSATSSPIDLSIVGVYNKDAHPSSLLFLCSLFVCGFLAIVEYSYALVTSFSPLTIWLHRGGFARFSHTRYTTNQKDMCNSFVHLTNVAIQKTASDYDKTIGSKWDLWGLKTFMISKHGLELTNDLFFEIQMLMVRSLLSVQKIVSLARPRALFYFRICIHKRLFCMGIFVHSGTHTLSPRYATDD